MLKTSHLGSHRLPLSARFAATSVANHPLNADPVTQPVAISVGPSGREDPTVLELGKFANLYVPLLSLACHAAYNRGNFAALFLLLSARTLDGLGLRGRRALNIELQIRSQ